MMENPDRKPATASILLRSLFSFTKEAVKDYPFPDPSGSWADCRVFLHGLPDSQETETWPFVIIRWLDGEIASEADGQTILRDSVALALGVYSPRSQAEAGLLCAELLDCLRYALWQKRVINRRFELVEPLRASMQPHEQKVHQYHLASIETVWNYVWPPKGAADLNAVNLKAGIFQKSAYSQPFVNKYFKE